MGEAAAFPINDSRVVVKFSRKKIFARFVVSRAIISDGGGHFCNQQLQSVLAKYEITHKVATPYHPQTNR